MPFRPRPIRWDLLVNPSMQALDIRARADARMNQNILSGLLNLGQGIRQGAASTESKRRFDITSGISQGHLDIRTAESEAQEGRLKQQELDRQEAESTYTDMLDNLVGQMNSTGKASPEQASQFQQVTEAVGGQRAASAKLQERAGLNGAETRPRVLSFEEFAANDCPT